MTLQKMKIHDVTKFIRNSSTEYFCETHNASYQSLKSFMADHPDFDKSEFHVMDKRIVGKLHTEVFSENKN